jgi:hypothetical protein
MNLDLRRNLVWGALWIDQGRIVNVRVWVIEYWICMRMVVVALSRFLLCLHKHRN